MIRRPRDTDGYRMPVSPLLHLPRNWDLIIAVSKSDGDDDDNDYDDNDAWKFKSDHMQLLTERDKWNPKFLPDIFWSFEMKPCFSIDWRKFLSNYLEEPGGFLELRS